MYGIAYAQGQSAVAGGWASGGMMQLVPIILMVVIFYFLLIRPQQKKEKQRLAMINNIQKGDRVLAAGGVYGTVVSTKDDVVVLKIATNTNVEFSKNSIQAKI